MQTQRTTVATSKNNIRVWYNPISSHAATHVTDTSNLLKLAAEVVDRTEIVGSYIQFHVDFGYTVGASDLVEIDDGDEIIYAKRQNRDHYTVFNRSKPAQPCSLVTVALQLQNDETYELVRTWIGPSDSPSFPGTKRETLDSKVFWSQHALAWGNQDIQAGTETTNCPW
jgi:hypothetical protein